jgi:D-3-phosphoglycerate dehydrogenase
MVKVLVCDEIHEDGINLLKNANFEVDIKLGLSPEQIKEVIGNYDAVIVRSRTKITKEIIEAGTNLKVIGRVGVGLDNVDVEAAQARGIKVANTPEAVSQSVAELTIGLMLCLARQLTIADMSMKQGEWLKSKFSGRQLAGKTLGIIGFGRIGSKVARVAKALGMRVIVYDIIVNESLLREIGVEWVPLVNLLRESDVITIHVPLTSQTKGMIGEKEIASMKNGAMIVNTARGAVIDEKALLKAIKSGKLAGAVLDVYETEPPKNLELIKCQNVICTPHIAAQTEEAQREAGILLAQKVIEAFKS